MVRQTFDGTRHHTRWSRLAVGQHLCPIPSRSSCSIPSRSASCSFDLHRCSIQTQGSSEKKSREADSRTQGNASPETEAVSVSRTDTTAACRPAETVLATSGHHSWHPPLPSVASDSSHQQFLTANDSKTKDAQDTWCRVRTIAGILEGIRQNTVLEIDSSSLLRCSIHPFSKVEVDTGGRFNLPNAEAITHDKVSLNLQVVLAEMAILYLKFK